VIDFQSWDKPTYTYTVWRMAVSDDYDLKSGLKRKRRLGNSYLMTPADERSAKHVDVVLDSPNLWMKKVGDHAGY
jgi:hypothetical protein